MRVILSPAKKMTVDTDSLPWRDLPRFLPEAQALCQVLQGMSEAQLKALWKCNDQIAQLNVDRLRQMDLHTQLTPAVLAYQGLQYQYMAPGVFTDEAYAYVQEHVRILSGLYGLLRPLDGVTPYRLEMQVKLAVGAHRDLYSYWGDRIALALAEETDCVLNLASKEYSQCVSRHLPKFVRFITCVFAQEQQGKLVEKGTMCKMARGELVRRMAEYHVTDPEQLKDIPVLTYRFSPEYSEENRYVFLMGRA